MTTRISEQDAKLLFGGGAQSPRKPARKRGQKAAKDLPENQVEAQILGWLRVKGWIIRRCQVGTYVPLWAARKPGANIHTSIVRIGEAGEPDYECLRPLSTPATGVIEYFRLEVKAAGKSLDPAQRQYIQNLNTLGVLATWADSLPMIQSWYKQHFER